MSIYIYIYTYIYMNIYIYICIYIYSIYFLPLLHLFIIDIPPENPLYTPDNKKRKERQTSLLSPYGKKSSFLNRFILFHIFICIHVYMYICIHVYMFICVSIRRRDRPPSYLFMEKNHHF
jgi:hypothetical protein